MRTHTRVLALGSVLTLGIAFLATATAADSEKELRETIDKLAEVSAKEPGKLRAEAAAVAKKMDSLEEMMNLFRKRTLMAGKVKGGWGIGAKATGQPDDGIEARIVNLSKNAKAAASAPDTKDLEQMAHRTAAMAEVTLAKAPAKKVGDKDPKDWKETSEEMSKSAQDLAKALKAKNAAAIKDAASKLNASCSNCHTKFRD